MINRKGARVASFVVGGSIIGTAAVYLLAHLIGAWTLLVVLASLFILVAWAES